MIILFANTEKLYFALEELHELLGLIVDQPLYFIAKGPGSDSIINGDVPSVVFVHCGEPRTIPDKIETQILDNILYVTTDILGVIAETLSRSEETSVQKDKYGRMAVATSAAYKQGTHQSAYIDNLVEQLTNVLMPYLASNGISYTCLTPWGRPVVCLTHDVDSIKAKSILRYCYIVLRSLMTLKNKEIQSAINHVNRLRNVKEDPHFSFSRFAQIESSFGFRSTFFVMSLPFFLSREGRRYSLSNPALGAVLREMITKGWEVALHTSKAASLCKAKMERELLRLAKFLQIVGHGAMGVRNHYLAGDFPMTWLFQEGLGLKYDSTIGWCECSGFRAGTAKPYRPFHNGLGRRLKLWELPLVTMDGSIPGSTDDIVEHCKSMAQEAFRYGRPFTLLWHTNRFNQIEYPEFRLAYISLLEYSKNCGCIGTTAGDVIDRYETYSLRLSAQRRRFDAK
jgi:hypothetical protein